MLACGCAAMSTHGNEHDGLPPNHPSCITHFDDPKGLGCKVVDAPDLTGRKARCMMYSDRPLKKPHRNSGPIYGGGEEAGMCDNRVGGGCRCEVPSSTDLPFFSHLASAQFDEFACGCIGWD